jgi:hypothetical protein
MEEDFDTLARAFSDKRESPIYTRDLTDPLGLSSGSRKVRAGSESLGDLFPNCEALGMGRVGGKEEEEGRRRGREGGEGEDGTEREG